MAQVEGIVETRLLAKGIVVFMQVEGRRAGKPDLGPRSSFVTLTSTLISWMVDGCAASGGWRRRARSQAASTPAIGVRAGNGSELMVTCQRPPATAADVTGKRIQSTPFQ